MISICDKNLTFLMQVLFQGRCINTLIVVVTVLLVFFTAISAFVSGASALDLFFVVCIVLFCISDLTLVTFYFETNFLSLLFILSM